MKNICTSQDITVPSNVDVAIKARTVRVSGPRGQLTRTFRHLDLELYILDNGRTIRVLAWFCTRKQASCVNTICSHISNMIKGVTLGFRYKMRLVYAHFPINPNVIDNGDGIEIRNFMGEHRVRRVTMQEGVKIERSENVKDELILEGNDIEAVSVSAAQIHHVSLVKRKDIRKFLDGIYVSEKTTVIDPDMLDDVEV